MPNSQNGWPVIPETDAGREKVTDLVLPGDMPHRVRVLKGDVAVIIRWLVAEYQKRVEPINSAGCWGWNVRKIGNGSTWSNHSSATALDINAPNNPDGAEPEEVMTAAQIKECHKLEAESDGVLSWGGDWSDPDPMHWEIKGTRAETAALAKKIQEGNDMDVKEFLVALESERAQNALERGAGVGVHNQELFRTNKTIGAFIKDTNDRLVAMETTLAEILAKLSNT